MSKKKTTTIVIIIIVLIGVWFLLFGNNQTDTTTNTNNNDLRIGSSALFVEDQEPGESADVSSAVLKDDGFVVIHQDANGNPGKIIGHSPYLGSGDYSNIEIGLDREVGSGETLYAMLHNDDGDRFFNPALDQPTIEDGLTPVMRMFKIIDPKLGDFETKQ